MEVEADPPRHQNHEEDLPLSWSPPTAAAL